MRMFLGARGGRRRHLGNERDEEVSFSGIAVLPASPDRTSWLLPSTPSSAVSGVRSTFVSIRRGIGDWCSWASMEAAMVSITDPDVRAEIESRLQPLQPYGLVPLIRLGVWFCDGLPRSVRDGLRHLVTGCSSAVQFLKDDHEPASGMLSTCSTTSMVWVRMNEEREYHAARGQSSHGEDVRDSGSDGGFEKPGLIDEHL